VIWDRGGNGEGGGSIAHAGFLSNACMELSCEHCLKGKIQNVGVSK